MAENTEQVPDRVFQYGNTIVRVFVHRLTDEERKARDERLSKVARRILARAELEAEKGRV